MNKDLLDEVKNHLGLKTTSETPSNPPVKDPFNPTEKEEKTEQIRTILFILGAFVFLGILAFQFLGRPWITGLAESEGVNYALIGLAIMASLIGANIILSILMGFFKIITLNSPIKREVEKNPIFKIASLVLGIYIAISIFTPTLKWMMEMGLNKKIETLIEDGFEFKFETDGEQKIFKFKDWDINIEALEKE